MRYADALVFIGGLAAASARENLCFTAHEKTALYCREAPVVGPLAVYDDTESPQRTRTAFYSKRGQLCNSARACRCAKIGSRACCCGGGAMGGGGRSFCSPHLVDVTSAGGSVACGESEGYGAGDD